MRQQTAVEAQNTGTMQTSVTIPLPFSTGDFIRQDNPVYEDLTKFQEVKKFMEEQLEDYNMEPGIIPMGLVLFRDAIEHGTYSVLCLPLTKGLLQHG